MSFQGGGKWLGTVQGVITIGSRKVRALEDSRVPVGRANGFLIFVILWSLLAWTTPSDLVPTPGRLFEIMWEFATTGVLWIHLWATLYATFWGFLGALVFGTLVGIVIALNDYARRFFVPYVMILLSISGVSSAAVATLIFGYSVWSPILATVATVFPYIAINIWKGTENINWDLIQMAESFNVSFFRTLRRSIIPNIAPSLFASFRFGLATAWKIVTITEMFAASKGLGYKLMNTYSLYKFQEAWAWGMVFLVVILLIEYVLFKPLERLAFEYRHDAEFNLFGTR